MSWRHRLFDFLYRLGMPVWHIPPPAGLRAVVEGPEALPTGRALDLGCGIGTNVIYLAQQGWEALGVDFSASAIQQARRKANGVSGATFIEGDVTKLREQGVRGPFDLVLDMGCLHSLPLASRRAYVEKIASVTWPGTLLLMWEVSERTKVPGGMKMMANEIADRFGNDFLIERVEARDFVKGRLKVKANWYWLRRR